MEFITGRPLWFNILIGLLVGLSLFALFLLLLGPITRHGKASIVPSVTGKNLAEAEFILDKAGFDIEILDSVYVDTMKPLTVIRQLPDADEIVKSNRTILLIVSRAIPPLIEMPNLVGYSYRNAEMVLKNMDLKIGDTTFKPDFARNAVLEQLYNGEQIRPGQQIRKGSTISLVLGDGIGKKEFVVPVITGMTYCDAKSVLESNGIVIGAIVADANVTDTCAAWIYKQNPEKYDEERRILRIRPGQTMDVWLQVDKPASKDSTDENLPLPNFP